MTRVVEVAPERLERWLAGFAERHGGCDATREPTPGGVVVRAVAPDGSTLVATPFAYTPLGIVLVRRGGYAAGLAVADRLVAAKVGSRHVQGRTAAGGWSQQRYARRRARQTDEVVAAAVRHARRVVLGEGPDAPEGVGGIPAGLVVGGDRGLVRAVLAPAGLGALADLPRRELYDLPDPTRAVLQTALRRARAYRVELSEPEPRP
ncbi:acVLRF1 family peptidyl-tRNA hydrolase [Intrasporangium sp.]|uniref:acVLRF1 family peptidyl-tRNA hydrolase n=1 Tax=Intrasporangium sp. TaxID=1925024 RepID=UPI0032213D8B